MPNFSWQLLDEYPTDRDGGPIQFPRDAKDYSNPLYILIQPENGQDWVGTFKGVNAQGIDERYFTGIFPCPDPDYLCVIAQGKGFIVRADNPDKYEEIDLAPILDARLTADPELIVMASFWNLVSYSGHSLLWATRRIAYDGIEIKEIKDGVIYGVSKNYDKEFPIAVNLSSGELIK